MKGYVYKLICPIDDNIKYIGQTMGSLRKRLKSHISKTRSKIIKKKKLSRKELWMKTLISINLELKIIIEEIEYCDVNMIDTKEIYWIEKMGENNNMLTNTTKGGHQPRGHKLGPMSDEHKMKISNGLKNSTIYYESLTNERSERISKSLKNKWLNDKEFVEMMLSKYTDSYRKALSNKSIGEKNPFFGKSHTIKFKENMSNIMKEYKGNKNSFYGKSHTEKTKETISTSLRLKPKKIILIFNLSEKLIKECDINEAMVFFGVKSPHNIYRNIRNSGMYHQHIIKYKEDIPIISKKDFNIEQLIESIKLIGYRKTSLLFNIPRSTLKRWTITKMDF